MGLTYTAGSGSIPTLSIKERDRRWQHIRDRMIERNIDCLIVWGDSRVWDWGTANMRYLTQIGGNGEEGLVVFPLESEPTAIIWNKLLAPGWRVMQNWVEVEGRARQGSYREILEEILADAGLSTGTIGLVGHPPTNIYPEIKKALADATVKDANGLIEQVRAQKSDEELTFLYRAAEIADATLEALVDLAEPGVTERELVAKMYETMTRQGGEPPYMLLLTSGSPPLPHPYRMATDRQLQPGDTIHTEFHPKYGGYVVHKARSIILGEPSDQQQAMIDIAKEAFSAGADAMAPGITVPEVERAIRTPILESAYSYREAKVHGHGLASGEQPNGTLTDDPPATLEETPRAKPYVVKPDMFPAINVNMATPDWRKGAVMIDDTFHVTENGADLMGEFPLGPVTK